MSSIQLPIKGIKVGHYTDKEGGTGVTTILFDIPAKGIVAFKGSAASTHQFDSLFLGHSVKNLDGICFTGGSAMGLASGTGVQKFLIEKEKGLRIRDKVIVPIIPTAAIFDLFYKKSTYPGEKEGYIAAKKANVEFETGSVGAGTGATVGKIFGYEHATKGGLGASFFSGEFFILVLVVVNNFGSVYNREGSIIAGVRDREGFINLRELNFSSSPFESTNLILMVTDANLDSNEMIIAGRIAANAFGRFFFPPNSSVDGDILVVVSIGDKKILPDLVGIKTIEVIGDAVEDAIFSAEGDSNIPSARSFLKNGN